MSDLHAMRYVPGATIQQLAPDECTVYLHKEHRPDPSDPEKSIEVEIWHQNVAVVGVPPGEPWLPPG